MCGRKGEVKSTLLHSYVFYRVDFKSHENSIKIIIYLCIYMDTDIIIVGGGLNGICASYYAKKNNYKFILFEKTNNIGGIWAHKNVPGIRTDSLATSYTYSFNKKYTEFGTNYPSGAQISKYIEDTAKKYKILQHIKLNTAVVKANFNTETNTWEVFTETKLYKCKYLINCNGYFNKNKYFEPKFTDSEKFENDIIHIYNINSPSIYKDKNVLLVGSGAMAISSMAELYPKSKSLTWLQRSPSYIYEADIKVNKKSRILKRLNNNIINEVVVTYDQFYFDLGFVIFKKFPNYGKNFFKKQYKRIGIPDEIVKKHLTPKYNPWDQRIPVSDPGILKLIGDGKIKTHTTSIDRFTNDEIILKNNEHIKNIDTVILATGFNINMCQFELSIDNEDIKYNDKMIYFKHCMIADIPNYIQIVGTLHSTYTVKMEILYRYVFKILGYARKHNYNCIKVYCRKTNLLNPNLKSNYLKRSEKIVPKSSGIRDIPTLDRIYGNYRFNKNDFIFYNNTEEYEYKLKNHKYKKNINVLLILLIFIVVMYIYRKIVHKR